MVRSSSKSRRNSVKTKIILSFTGLILVFSIVLGFMVEKIASNILISQAKETILSLAEEAAEVEDGRLSIQKKVLETIAAMEEVQGMNQNDVLPLLKQVLENQESFSEIGIVDMDGKITYSSGTILELEESDSVRIAVESGKEMIHFGISPSSKELVLVQTVPIIKDGKTVGAVIGRRDGEAISTMASDKGYGESGYGYIVDSTGTVIGHKNREMVTSMYNPIEVAKTDDSVAQLAETMEAVLQNTSGTGAYEFNGGKQFVGYAEITGTDWKFILVAEESEILHPIAVLRNYIIGVVVIMLAISILITYFLGQSITGPIISTIEFANKLSELDLTENVEQKYLDIKDEIGDLAHSLQNIISGLRKIIKEINGSAEQIAVSSQELTATSQQTAATSEEIAKTVEEIAQGASEQAKNTETGSLKAVALGDSIEKVKELIEHVNASSNNATNIVWEGIHEIDGLSKITEESTSAIEEIYQVVLKTNESSNKISEASNVIESIATQTNLLSLNAAIEAARAGDAGKGFAVVAEEVRKLAEQSANSTKLIHEIVTELQTNTEDAVQTMKRVAVISKEQAESVSSSKQKYKMIADSMKESLAAVKQLSVSGEEMNKMRSDIMEILSNLSAIAEENAAAAEESSAATQEQTASVEEIAGASDTLSSLAQNLYGLVEKFKLN